MNRVRARDARNAATSLLVSGHLPAGRTDSRALNLLLREFAKTKGSFAGARAFLSGCAGSSMTFAIDCVMKFSNAIRCSIFSAVDQRPGVSRKRHCGEVRPSTSSSSRASLEVSRASTSFRSNARMGTASTRWLGSRLRIGLSWALWQSPFFLGRGSRYGEADLLPQRLSQPFHHFHLPMLHARVFPDAHPMPSTLDRY